MDWMKGKFMKYHISDKEYDMIQKDIQEEISFVRKMSISLHTTDACRCAHMGSLVYKQK